MINGVENCVYASSKINNFENHSRGSSVALRNLDFG
jgi:hypothetical protein